MTDGARAIDRALDAARQAGRLAFVPYITAGDPELATTRRLARALAGAGADVLELGVPWSDPLADGPVNQRAAERALSAGTTLQGILEAAPAIRAAAGIPLVLFTYYNPILRYGPARFAAAAAAAGIDGVLVTDLPPEEAAGQYLDPLRQQGLASIFLATPTSTERRLEQVARSSSGFVYLVSRTGVTGAKTDVHPLGALVRRVRRHTGLPVAVGFGISEPEQVLALHGLADAFVVGSALVDAFARAVDATGVDAALETVARLAATLAAAGRAS